MSKELLEQLKRGGKVWVELEVIMEIDEEGDVQVQGYSCGRAESMFLDHSNNFSLSDPNELTVRELCEFIKKKGDGDVDYSIELYNDFSGGSRDGVIHFYSLEELTELVRNPNALRKEEIKKQIEELQKELKEL